MKSDRRRILKEINDQKELKAAYSAAGNKQKAAECDARIDSLQSDLIDLYFRRGKQECTQAK